ncbi:uncharacterized protein MKK02DRAFT_42206 [Dioszegia hungarica]|uniref:Extracellular membrane protein CFEM domain-containing protein n=1 Tax=Dioszegia hungarica TaxID=4972 RepID=A0AA38HCV9_9TREE|nr:uncharacterized protein MKK02DRAFT_42206 [Dioszegia hungarica]KAI9637833.1 hypothetical protein MKK02DRAFT_42206 [Dioszegia hungarica]
MHFLALALPLLSVTLASPLPSPETAELAVRHAAAALSARTFFEHDWRCSSDSAKSDCKFQGDQYACDSSCNCVSAPQDSAVYCPLRDLKKKACELKKGFTFDDDSCACTGASTSTSSCPDGLAQSVACIKELGWFDFDSCSCQKQSVPSYAQPSTSPCSTTSTASASSTTSTASTTSAASTAPTTAPSSPAYTYTKSDPTTTAKATCPDSLTQSIACVKQFGWFDFESCSCKQLSVPVPSYSVPSYSIPSYSVPAYSAPAHPVSSYSAPSPTVSVPAYTKPEPSPSSYSTTSTASSSSVAYSAVPSPKASCPDSLVQSLACVKQLGWFDFDACSCQHVSVPSYSKPSISISVSIPAYSKPELTVSPSSTTSPAAPSATTTAKATCSDSIAQSLACVKQLGWFDFESCLCQKLSVSVPVYSLPSLALSAPAYSKQPEPTTSPCSTTSTATSSAKTSTATTTSSVSTAAPTSTWSAKPQPTDSGSCGNSWLVMLCKLKGKGCNSQCNCF